MQLNKWYLVVACLLLGRWDGTAATTIASAYGTQLVFGDWSKPETVLVESSEGLTPLVRRVCSVSEQHSLSVNERSLVVRISSSNSRADPEIVLSPDLNILSTKVLELDAFGRPDYGARLILHRAEDVSHSP